MSPAEAHELGVDLLVNSDGIPALSVHGVDVTRDHLILIALQLCLTCSPCAQTLEDSARILQNNASSIKSSAVHRGVVELQHDIPGERAYPPSPPISRALQSSHFSHTLLASFCAWPAAAEIYALVIAENVCRQLETGTPELRKGKLVLVS